jgi:hypothetical protein
MKKLKTISLFAFALIFAFFLASCGEGSDHQAGHDHDHGTTEVAAHGDGPEYISAYVCPMHCAGSGSDSEGNCPVCGMAYVAQADHASDGHIHGGDGHQH